MHWLWLVLDQLVGIAVVAISFWIALIVGALACLVTPPLGDLFLVSLIAALVATAPDPFVSAQPEHLRIVVSSSACLVAYGVVLWLLRRIAKLRPMDALKVGTLGACVFGLIATATSFL